MAEATADTKRFDQCAHESCVCNMQPGAECRGEHCPPARRNASAMSTQQGQSGCGHPACN